MGSRKYHQLNDEQWLRQKYVEEDLSTRSIAELVGGRSPHPVIYALKGFGIPLRNYREGKVRNRETDHFVLNLPVIYGCLLGDGNLSDRYHSPVSAPYFRKSQKDRDHMLYVAELLFQKDAEQKVKESCYFNKRDNKYYTSYSIRSLSHDFLKPLVEEWYPEASGYHKVVPASLEIDGTVLLHWFMDDGTSYRKASRKSPGSDIIFCSEGFLREDQEMLAQKVNDRYDLAMRLFTYPKGTGYRLRVPADHSVEFYDVIGPCPVASMSHKWKGIPQNEKGSDSWHIRPNNGGSYGCDP